MPVTVVCPGQALDRYSLGPLPVVEGECGTVHQVYFVCKGSYANREGCRHLDVTTWDRRGGSSSTKESGPAKGAAAIT